MDNMIEWPFPEPNRVRIWADDEPEYNQRMWLIGVKARAAEAYLDWLDAMELTADDLK